VGQVEVRLPSTGKFNFKIDGGIGNLKIRLPGRIGVHIDLDSGLGSFNAGSRLRSIGNNVYETEGFASASDQITLKIDAGIGSINVIDAE
jgi:predicted membrane protein